MVCPWGLNAPLAATVALRGIPEMEMKMNRDDREPGMSESESMEPVDAFVSPWVFRHLVRLGIVVTMEPVTAPGDETVTLKLAAQDGVEL